MTADDHTHTEYAGRIALITGANKGIGFETARQLGEYGMRVLVGARDTGRGEDAASSLREQGIDAHFIEIDVTDQQAVDAAAKRIDEEFGRLDVLVNNAGISGMGGGSVPPSETSLAALHEVFATNVDGPIRVTNAMLPLLERAEAARIVNVSSALGSISERSDPETSTSGLPPTLQYPASKAALNMITAQYAVELRDSPIKINAANPGYTSTDFTHHHGTRTAAQGAEPSVHLALLRPDGPSGVLYGYLATHDNGNGPSAEEYGILNW